MKVVDKRLQQVKGDVVDSEDYKKSSSAGSTCTQYAGMDRTRHVRSDAFISSAVSQKR
jgi:hypothetical protein